MLMGSEVGLPGVEGVARERERGRARSCRRGGGGGLVGLRWAGDGLTESWGRKWVSISWAGID